MKDIKSSLKDQNQLLKFQKNEITEYLIYNNLVNATKKEKNKQILQQIAKEKLRHHNVFKSLTKKEVNPNKLKVNFYIALSKILGLTFSLKLMKNGEGKVKTSYEQNNAIVRELEEIKSKEGRHEEEFLSMIEEEYLNYIGSIVLGLNDALVELIGALAGFTLALQNGALIASSGLITGIAAALSMAASEYLSKKAENDEKALKSSIYSGLTYIVTVILLILPFLLMPKNYFLSLIITLIIAILILLVFNFFISVVKNLNFKKRFIEMATISLGVAAFTFFIGYLVRITLGISI